MGIPAYVYGFKSFGKKTEAAGTIIQRNVPGQDGRSLALMELLVTTQGTAHTLSLMYAAGTGTRIAAAQAEASGQATLLCDAAPKDPAGNAAASGDVIAYQLSNGTWEFNTVSSLASNDITLTNNIGSPGIALGGKVRIMGVVADGAVIQFPLAASTDNHYGLGELVAVHPYPSDPWVLQIDNGTAASTLKNAVFAYINKDGGGA
jgi:hypothetical protein